MSIFTKSKKQLEIYEKELKKKFFHMYDNAKEMIEDQRAGVVSSDKNLVIEVSDICKKKELQKAG